MPTAIEWTQETWNPVTGCDRVSSGCDNCYALTLAKRLKAMGNPRYQNDGRPETSGPGFKVTMHRDKLDDPLRWRSPKHVFVDSMSDLFHPAVDDEFVFRVFETMEATPQHTYQILTKRPSRMRAFVGCLGDAHGVRYGNQPPEFPWPIPNVWLGVSVEDQEQADKRIPLLLETDAAVRFLSCEPLLGPIDIEAYLGYHIGASGRYWMGDNGSVGWVIVGGESGPQARPMEPAWVLALRDQCIAAGVPFFFKQHGGRTPKAGGRELDGRTWDEMPEVAQ
jgi:protein gp37